MSATPAAPALRRDPANGVVAGVCAGVGARLGIDPVLLRVGLVLLTVATAGFALIAYVIAWIAIPAGDAQAPVLSALRAIPAPRVRRGGWRIAAGVGLLTLAALLVFRELGLWWSDALVWPLILASSGVALLWRQSRAMQPEPHPAPRVLPAATAPPAEQPRAGVADLYRGGFGIALVIGAALLFLSANDALGQTRDVVLAISAAVIALALILAPFLWRLGRNLASERAERIRSQERAEMAAHVHDSVLQTLTLMQKRADDPRAVAALARRQERELRGWLLDGAARSDGSSVAAALETAAAEVEDAHGVPIDVITVGDRELGIATEALVAATREALTNAAKFAGDSGPVAVYAELGPRRAEVYVRDRGRGFDPGRVPPDRRGVRESIVGRMERNGGTATVRSAPGSGTEVELRIAEQSE